MASSSSSKNKERGFSGIEPPGTRRKVSESTTLYDVFINHRGPDSKQTLALPLYESLQELGIRAFLDKEEMELGQSFPSTIETAISSAAVHIAIFSRGYAESPWCLAELVLMQQTQAKIIPVLYGVQPWELRHIEKGPYADAFIEYQNKSRYLEKLDEWKEALRSISYTTGLEIKDLNVCDLKSIVVAVEKEVQRTKPLQVAIHPVALDKIVHDFERRCLEKLVQDFEFHCRMNEGKGKAGIVGVFGMGGVGKTTLCKELFNRRRHLYDRTCFPFDVREASTRSNLPSLQKKLLKDLFNVKKLSFETAEEGSSYICNRIASSCSWSFLIVIDDVDHLEQLDALPIMHMPGNSLVIITTRDEGILIAEGIEVRYHLKEMDKEDARQLFSLHAFSHPHPARGYEDLVDDFIGVCGGLPVSLQVLGRHVRGRNEYYWRSALKKLGGGKLHPDIKKKLQISFDALEYEEKQMFIDMAGFFVDQLKSIAIRVWEASGWDAQYRLQTLKDRCLVEEIFEELIEDEFLVEEIDDPVPILRMHDHLRDLGREMANERTQPPRLWRPQDLKNLESRGFEKILTQTNGRCFHSFFDESLKSKITFLLGELDDSAAPPTSLLLLQLDVDGYSSDSIPSWIPLQNMQCFRIYNGHFKRLWRQDVQAPSQLRVLEISGTFLIEFPDFLGILTNVEKEVIEGEHMAAIESLPLVGSSPKNLQVLDANDGRKSAPVKVPLILLENLVISEQENIIKIVISGNRCPKLQSLELFGMKNLFEVKFSNCEDFETFNCLKISDCEDLKRLSVTSNLKKLEELNISACSQLEDANLGHLGHLKRITIADCKLKSVPGISYFGTLVELNIKRCSMLHGLSLPQQGCLEKVMIENCSNLNSVTGISDLPKLVELSISLCSKLQLDLHLVGLNFLKRMTVDSSVKVKSFELDGCTHLETVSGANIDFRKIHMVNISACPELRELPFICGASCLEIMTINGCVKLNTLKLTNCRILKRLCGNFDLAELSIKDCPMLKELPCFGHLTCLKEIHIIRCGKMQAITLPSSLTKLTLEVCMELQKLEGISGLTELVELNIKNSPELEVDLHLSGSNCLYRISVEYCNVQNMTLPVTLRELKVQKCRKLQRIAGLEDLTELTELYIIECPELEEIPNLARASHFERIKIVSCDKLQIITLPIKLIKLTVQCCRHLRRIAAMDDLKELTEIYISECSELEELPVICVLSGLERITIDGCGKLNLRVNRCGSLKGVSGNFAQLWLSDCPELEELPCFEHSAFLEEIHVFRCGKLQEITLPTTLKLLHLDSCTELQNVSEISHLNNLVQLIISECWQLELKMHLEGMNSLQSIMFDGCGKLKSFMLNKCQNLKSVSGNFDVERLSICDCPELEELSIRPGLRCLESIHIKACFKLQNITLRTKLTKLILQRCRHLPRIAGMDDLTELCISECEEPDELSSLVGLSCLTRIKIDSCKKLHNITLPTVLNELLVHRCIWQMMEGISNLTKLSKMSISECPEVKELPILAGLNCLESINIDSCERLHNITLPATLINLRVHWCMKLQRVAGTGNLTKLTYMAISNCPELEELPNLSEMSCLESINIDFCERLHNITLPTTLMKLTLRWCTKLQRVAGTRNLTKLTDMVISKCPELEELPNLSKMSCLESINIDFCERLHNITLPTTLMKLAVSRCRKLQLAGTGNLTNVVISNCPELEELSNLSEMSCLESITIDFCERLHNITLPTSLMKLTVSQCIKLQRVAGIGNLTKFTDMVISYCPELEELSNVSQMSCLESINIDFCERLHNITLPNTLVKLIVRSCIKLQRVAGTGKFTKLTDMVISKCPELEELPNLSKMSCLKSINIDFCDRLLNITLPATLMKLAVSQCRKLQLAGIGNLANMVISKCPELEELPNLWKMSCLESIKIDLCERLHNITLPTSLMKLTVRQCKKLQRVAGIGDLTKLTDTVISKCPELEELPNLSEMSCLESISIDFCERLHSITLPTTLMKLTVRWCIKLQRVAGNGNLTKLADMVISKCPELEELPNLSEMSCLESINIDFCERLHDITLPPTLTKLTVRWCIKLQQVAGTANLTKLRNIVVSKCPELEELPNLSKMNCLESINFDFCERLHNITLPTTLMKLTVSRCRKLQRVAGINYPTKLECIQISECPNVEELPSLARLSCLKNISIGSCMKLQNIGGIEELEALEAMQLLFCSNAAVQDCIRKLKSVPSAFIQVVGKAADGAEANLNPSLLCEAIFFEDAATLCSTLYYHEESVSAIIVCGVVEGCSSALLPTIYDQRSGEWIITTVISDQYYMQHYLTDSQHQDCFPRLVDFEKRKMGQYIVTEGKMKKWCAWAVRKGEDWRTLPALTTIVDKLHHK